MKKNLNEFVHVNLVIYQLPKFQVPDKFKMPNTGKV